MNNLNITDLGGVLECLSDEELGIVMRAIFEYAETEEEPETIKQLKTIKNEKNKVVLIVFSILKNKLFNKKVGAKKGNKNACKNQAISNIKKTIKNNKKQKNEIVLIDFNEKEENEKEKEIKEKDKEVKSNLVSKKESKNINIFKNNITCARESYDELIDVFEFSGPVRRKVGNFIQHCLANKHVLINDELEGILAELDLRYPSDEARMQALDDAIKFGYFGLRGVG